MSYIIAGRAVKNEYLALGTIFTAIGATLYSTSGKEKPPATPTGPVSVKQDPTIKADTKEEEDLMDSIRQFVAAAESEGPAGSAH